MKRHLEDLVLDARRITADEGPILVEAAGEPETRVVYGHGIRLAGRIADAAFLQASKGAEDAASTAKGNRLLQQVVSVLVPGGTTEISGIRPLLQRCDLRGRSSCVLCVDFSGPVLEAIREHQQSGSSTVAFTASARSLAAFQEATPTFDSYTGVIGVGGIELGWEFEAVEVHRDELLLFDKSYRNLPRAARLAVGGTNRQHAIENCQRVRELVDHRTLSSLYRAVSPE